MTEEVYFDNITIHCGLINTGILLDFVDILIHPSISINIYPQQIMTHTFSLSFILAMLSMK